MSLAARAGWSPRDAHGRQPTRAGLAPVVAAVAAKQLVVPISERLPLAEVEAAHAKSMTGRMTGKLVLLAR